MLDGGGVCASFKLGDTVNITATDTKGFTHWVNSEGVKISDEINYTFVVGADSSDETFTAICGKEYPSASFDDLSEGEIITKTNSYSDGLGFYHSQSTEGSSVTVVADPRGHGNVLKFSKTDRTTGDTVCFIPEKDGTTCFVLEFDFCIEDTSCTVPIQINMGGCYRLQLEVTQSHLLFYDAKANGSEKHFLGTSVKFGEWIRVRVEYFPGDMTESGQYAKVYFDDTLAAISQNSASKSISSNYDFVRFYQLIASNASFLLDNVSVYSCDKVFTDTDEDIVRILHGMTADSEFEDRFDISEAVLGKDASNKLKELCALFEDDLYIWLANLYDPGTGGFYYSNDARDFEGFLADIESTAQAMNLISSMGLGKAENIYTDEMKALVVAWVQSLQAEDDGYFYHPQWGKDIGVSRRGRDFGNSINVLNRFGAEPLYPTALDRLRGDAEPTSSVILTSSLSSSRTVAVSRVIGVSSTATNSHLKSEEAFIEYLDELFATVTTTSSGGEKIPNSYSIGNTVASQVSAIKAAGLSQVCVDYFNGVQSSETGLWDADKNYRSISGLLKISSLYNSLGAKIPYIDKAIRSCIDVAASNDPLSAIVYVYNPLAGLSNLLTNLNKYNTDEGSRTIRFAAISEMQERSVELIENTHRKLALFKKADGSFSYNTWGAPAASQGSTVCFGANEGDVNGTALANGTIKSLCSCMGISRPAYYSSEDAEIFKELLRNREPVIKQSVNDLDIDFESVEPETGLPKFITASAISEGASYSLVSDSVYGKVSQVIVLNSTKGKNDSIALKFPCTLKDVSCYSYSADISLAPAADNSTSNLAQLKIGNAYMIAFVKSSSNGMIKLTDASSVGSGNKTSDLGISVKAGEWFNLRVDYFVGTADTVCILIYIDGELRAISDNYYGSKIDGKPLPAPASSVNTVSIQSLMAAAIELKMDNIKIIATDLALPSEIIPEKNTFEGFAEGDVPLGMSNSINSGGSAGVAFDGENGYYSVISKSGAGDTTSITPAIGKGDAAKYVLDAKFNYVSTNNTTVTQLFFATSKGNCFALDITSYSGKISIVERTSSGAGATLITDIKKEIEFELTVEYYPELGTADITVKQNGEVYTARTDAYYSDSAKSATFSALRIYSLISARIELHIDDLGVYNIVKK